MSPPDPKSEFDEFRETYSAEVNRAISFSGLDVDFFTRAKAERLVDLIRRNEGSPQSVSILDVGCGIGNFHPLLREKVGKVTGVDPSPDCIEEARKRNPGIPYFVADGDVLPFDDACFDTAFAICVMHHVPPLKWKQFVGEMTRVVRPGGLVTIFEHNPFNPVVRRVVSNCPFDQNAVLLRKKQVAGYLDEAGLADVCGRYILTIPSVSGWLRIVDDWFGHVPLGAQYYVAGKRR